MAGWLDDFFRSGNQSPEGLLAMLSQMAQAQAGPSGGCPAAGPQPGGAMMPMPPPTQMSDASGGPLMPLGASPMGPPAPGPLPPGEPPPGATPVKTVEGTVENKPTAGNGTLYMPGARAEAPAALAAPATQP